MRTNNDDTEKVFKGVPSHYVKESFNSSDYKKFVENILVKRAKVVTITPLKFRNYTVCVEKNAISIISDKVYLRVYGVKLLPNGHYLTSD